MLEKLTDLRPSLILVRRGPLQSVAVNSENSSHMPLISIPVN